MSRLRLTKITAPAAPPTTTAELFYSLADSRLEVIDENGNIARLAGFTTADYRLIRVFMITASGTYALTGGTIQMTPGTRALYVECIGAGGGSGAIAATTSNVAAAGGGGGGGYSAYFIASAASSYSVTIGQGGAAGTSAGAGGAGGSTIFGSNIVVANGGTGGGAGTTPGTAAASSLGGVGGSLTGAAGDLISAGTNGMDAVVVSSTVASGGGGAPGPWGGGYAALWRANGGSNGALTCPGPGAGAVGPCRTTTGAALSGATGANGIIRVWEFA